MNKKRMTIAVMCTAMAIPMMGATNKSKQNFLSDESASKLQVKKNHFRKAGSN